VTRALFIGASRLALIQCVTLTAHAENSPADAKQRSIEVGIELTYSFPIGSLEGGSEVSDVVRGLIPIGVDVGFRLTTRVAILLYGHYGVGIPKLCTSASDCFSSLGRDVAVGAGSRLLFDRLGPVAPELRLTFSYEWLHSALSDNGVTSSRDYRGPLLAAIQAFGNFGSDAKKFGAFASLATGIFSNRSLETPAFSSAELVDRPSLHVWLAVGLRGALSF